MIKILLEYKALLGNLVPANNVDVTLKSTTHVNRDNLLEAKHKPQCGGMEMAHHKDPKVSKGPPDPWGKLHSTSQKSQTRPCAGYKFGISCMKNYAPQVILTETSPQPQ